MYIHHAQRSIHSTSVIYKRFVAGNRKGRNIPQVICGGRLCIVIANLHTQSETEAKTRKHQDITCDNKKEG